MAFRIRRIAYLLAFTLSLISLQLIAVDAEPAPAQKPKSTSNQILKAKPKGRVANKPTKVSKGKGRGFGGANQNQIQGNQNNPGYGGNQNNPGYGGIRNQAPGGFNNIIPGGQQPLGKDQFTLDFESYVSHLPISSFEGDAILIQFPDRLSGRTTYRHLNPKTIDNIVYETATMDAESDVVILTADEDKIPPSKNTLKRVYVVLRRALLLDPKLYYVAYVYVTDAPDGSRGIHNLGDRRVYLEWDFWDHREVEDAAAKQLEYAFGCSNTIFIPCVSNETLDFPTPNQKPRDRAQRGDPNGLGISTSDPSGIRRSYPTSDGGLLHVAEGYDPNDFMDIYWDLEKELQKSKPVNTNEQSSVPMPPMGRGMGIVSAVLNTGQEVMHQGRAFVTGVINTLFQAGMGLTKSFSGLYGGLGTSEADLGAVTNELGIEGSDDITAFNDPAENTELEAEVKENTAGGLGGLLNMSPEEYAKTAKGRAIGKAWDPVVEEKPYVQFGWRLANDVNSANDPFVGFGGCRYRRVTAEDLEKTVTESDLIRFYKTALKTQCILYDGEFLQEILNDGVLRSQLDKTFKLVKESPHFQLEKLNVKQLKELLRGVELHVWSKTYAQELRSPTPSTTAPDGSTLSRSVFTLGQSFIYATAMAKEELYPMKHGFKIGRNLVKTLKAAYLKLLEDIQLVGEEDTGFEREINFNDRVYIMSISQYLIHGVAPVFMDNQVNPQKNFEDFYRKNKPFLEDRVNSQTPI